MKEQKRLLNICPPLPRLDSSLVPTEGGGRGSPSPTGPQHLTHALSAAYSGGPGGCGWAAGGPGRGSVCAAACTAAGQGAPGSPGPRGGPW